MALAEVTETFKTCFKKMAVLIQEQGWPDLSFNDSLLASKFINKLCLNVTFEHLKQSRQVLDVERIYDADLAVQLYGYITPIIAIITIVLNIAIIAILSGKELRSPTNSILISIAVFDTLTITCTLPWFIKMYSTRSYSQYPSMPWCRVFRYLNGFLASVFHNTVIWLTVMLAIHRYIGISRPNMARKLCSYRSVFGGIFSILFLMTIFYSTNLITEKLEPVRAVGKELLTSSGVAWVDTCKMVPSPHVVDFYPTYTKVYWWCRVALGQIIPCVVLLIFNLTLLRRTCKSYKYRSLLVRGNHPAERSHLKEVLRTSTMLIAICACTLIVEIPITVIFVLNVLQTQHGLVISDVNILKTCHTIPNFMMFLTFPINFFIYLTLSGAFRKRLLSIAVCIKKKSRDTVISMSVLSSRV